MPGTIWAIVAISLLWLVAAAALAVLAARRFRVAQDVISAARSGASLLEMTPARPLLVRPDGAVEVDPRLARDLGLPSAPDRLEGLTANDGGIAAEDFARLTQEIDGARVSAGHIACKVRANGSSRVFEVRGGPAPPSERPGTLLLWFFDTSASEEDRAKLALRLRQTEGALDSLTHLIEAAPFPMWYRGPDLKLGLVNSAFVAAVEGKDASDVIGRGLELIDAQGEDSAAASARKASESARIVSRMQPAIVRGERRMLRIVNVPLASS